MNKWLLVKVSVRVRVFGLDMTESVRIIREDRDGQEYNRVLGELLRGQGNINGIQREPVRLLALARFRFVSRQPPPRRPTTGQLNRGSPVNARAS